MKSIVKDNIFSVMEEIEGNPLINDPKQDKRRSINAACTNGVSIEDYNAILSRLQEILKETGRNLKVNSSANSSYELESEEYNSPDWYIEKCITNRERGFGKQVGSLNLIRLLYTEPFQKTNLHVDLFVIDKDLTLNPEYYPDNNFIFGQCCYPAIIISTARFQGIKNKNLKKKTLEILTAHEIGHSVGLVSRIDNNSWNSASSMYKKHHCNGEKEACLV